MSDTDIDSVRQDDIVSLCYDTANPFLRRADGGEINTLVGLCIHV